MQEISKTDAESQQTKYRVCPCVEQVEPRYNFPNETYGRWCRLCPDRPAGTIDVRNSRCEKCETVPNFGMREEMRARWCKQHKPAKAVNVKMFKSRKCEADGCEHQANYNHAGQKSARWCKVHREPLTVDVCSLYCETCGIVHASFRLPDETRARWCKLHKPESAVPKAGMCDGCHEIAGSFRSPSNPGKTYCVTCAPADKVQRKGYFCEGKGCGKNANYGLLSDRVPRWCSPCAQRIPEAAKAVDVKRRRCKCGEGFPSWFEPGEKTVGYCDACPEKPETATRKQRKLKASTAHARERKSRSSPTTSQKPPSSNRVCCLCHTARALYGRLGSYPSHCQKCVPNADFVTQPRRKCDQCSNLAIYGVGRRHVHCALHAEPSETNIVERPCTACDRTTVLIADEKCGDCVRIKNARLRTGDAAQQKPPDNKAEKQPKKKRVLSTEPLPARPRATKKPSFYKPCKQCPEVAVCGDATDKIPIHCETHRQSAEVNLERPCACCTLPYILMPNNRCATCQPGVFEKFKKRKEERVKQLLSENKIEWESHDKTVDTKCSKLRPDFLFDHHTHFTVLEVDEDAHQRHARECFCEQSRMVNIMGDIGMKTRFIRYNPDSTKNDLGLDVPLPLRERHLLEWLTWSKTHEPKDACEVVYLFYDGRGADPEDVRPVDQPVFVQAKSQKKRKMK